MQNNYAIDLVILLHVLWGLYYDVYDIGLALGLLPGPTPGPVL